MQIDLNSDMGESFGAYTPSALAAATVSRITAGSPP